MSEFEKAADIEADTPIAAGSDSAATDGYAFRYGSGQIECDSVAESPAAVRERMLRDHMGWRYEQPKRYSHDEKWENLLTYGSVVPVSIKVVDA